MPNKSDLGMHPARGKIVLGQSRVAMTFDLSELWVFGLMVVLALIVGAAVVALFLSLFSRLAERTKYQVDDTLIKHLRWPLQCLLPVLLVHPILGFAELSVAPLRMASRRSAFCRLA